MTTEIIEIHVLAADGTRVTDVDELEKVQTALKAQAENGNIEVTDMEKKHNNGKHFRTFILRPGHIYMYEREWGIIREKEDDVSEVSKLFPNYALELIFTWYNSNVDSIEALPNYAKSKHHKGEIVAIYSAEPITWSQQDLTRW